MINNFTNKITFCFATMCKNEEHCILETLESVYKYCDYWIICDTGSTDNTCKIIKDFFKEKNIPGELYIDTWVNFGYNKTLLFQRCYNKTDYIIHCDADDLLIGDFNFNVDDKNYIAYEVLMKRGDHTYTNLVIFNNKYNWKICGVAHTYAKCIDNIDNLTICNFSHKNFYILSRDTGSRNNDPDKYYKDAIILQKQFFDTLIDDEDNLNSRSVFYTAQSYYDSNQILDSLKWYNLYLKLNSSWNEEIFESYIRIASCFSILETNEYNYQENNNYYFNNIIKYLNKAMDLFNDRAEPYFELGKYYLQKKMYYESYIFFKIAQNKNYDNVKNKYNLFINKYSYGNNVNNYINECIYNISKINYNINDFVYP